MKHIAIIQTGGTIEKTYDQFSGLLGNNVSVLDFLLDQLVLEGVTVHRQPLMNKDSLDMTLEDHQLIATVALHAAENSDGVVIVHGTDRLATTGHTIYEMATPKTPIILTGAMRPFELRTSDATQNMTEALLAAQLVEPGVYVAMHNKVLQFPGPYKDKEHGTFTIGPKK